MNDLNAAPPAPPTEPERLPLADLYPRCFDWENPRPVKVKIHKDLVHAGYGRDIAQRSLAAYCLKDRYQHALQEGATRIDLNGEPAGVVDAREAAHALHVLARRVKREARRAAGPPPATTPLPEENLVPGRLELSLKFSELPRPLPVQGGLKIGVHTEEATVTAILPPKVWKKLEQAAADYSAWVAVVSGALDRFEDGEIALKNPAVQVFEKKAKPAAEPGGQADAAPAPPVPPAARAPDPVAVKAPGAPGSPVVRATLSLRDKPQKTA